MASLGEEINRRQSIMSTLGIGGGGVTFAAGVSIGGGEGTPSPPKRHSLGFVNNLTQQQHHSPGDRRPSILRRKESTYSRRSGKEGFARKASYNDTQHNIHNEILDTVLEVAKEQAEQRQEQHEKMTKLSRQVHSLHSSVGALTSSVSNLQKMIVLQVSQVRRESKDEYAADPVNAIAPLQSSRASISTPSIVGGVAPFRKGMSVSTVGGLQAQPDLPPSLAAMVSSQSNILLEEDFGDLGGVGGSASPPQRDLEDDENFLSANPKGYHIASSFSEDGTSTGSGSDHVNFDGPPPDDSSFNNRVKHAERHLAINHHYRTGTGVVLPEHTLRKTADIMYLILALLESYECLFTLMYPSAIPIPYKIMLKGLFTIGHVIFIYIVSRTAVLSGYALEDSSLSVIRSIYLKTWLPFDIVTSLPYDMFVFGGVTVTRWLAVPRLAHVARVPTLLATANPLKQVSGWITGLKAGFWFFWGLHIMGILFTLIDTGVDAESVYPDSDFNEIFDKYLYGLYWATVTVSSVGFGDVVPQTRWSRIYTIPVVLISVLVLSVFTGQVASSVIRLDAFQQVVKDKKAKLYSLMERYEVPWEVQKEAFAIYPTLLETSLKDYFDILRDLPPFMQDKVILCIKKKIVSQVPLFKEVDEKTLTALAAVTQQVLVAPNEFIIEAGGIGHEMYFIAQGVVEVLVIDEFGDEICAATLQSGSWFGEIALLKHTQRTASVRSVTACSCFKLLKEDFIGILKIYPDFEVQMQASVEKRLQEIAAPTTQTMQPESYRSESPIAEDRSQNGSKNPLTGPPSRMSPRTIHDSISVSSPTLSEEELPPPLPPAIEGSPRHIASVGSFKLDRVLSKGDMRKMRGEGHVRMSPGGHLPLPPAATSSP